jgi:hypothetical protein
MKRLLLVCLTGVFVAGAAWADRPVWSNLAPEGYVPGPVVPQGGGCPCVSGTPEGEANCGLPNDTVNGGCNSVPEVTSPIGLNDPVCGTSGASGGTRDTDWYEFEVTTGGSFTWQVEAEFAANIFILDAVCPPSLLGSDATTGCGDVGQITLDLTPGTYRFFVAFNAFDGLACGSEYTATLIGDEAPTVLEVPTVSTIGLVAIALLLGGFAFYLLRRRAA